MWLCKLRPKTLNVKHCFRYYADNVSNVNNTGKKTYYEILNVKPRASQEEIRNSFLKLSKVLHPDTAVGNEKETHNAFILLNEAYTVLSKPALRRIYDRKLQGIVPAQKKEMQYSHRTANYKNPYLKYDTRKREESWTDYHGVLGRKRAKHRMEQDLDNEFWQKHWKFSQDHGGGGPKIASHTNFIQPAKMGDSYVMAFVVFIVVLSAYVMASTEGSKNEYESITEDYHVWLVEQTSKEKEPIPKMKLPEFFTYE